MQMDSLDLKLNGLSGKYIITLLLTDFHRESRRKFHSDEFPKLFQMLERSDHFQNVE